MIGAAQLVETMHVKNFACIGDVQVRLTPLHAFIGPNDSGKSTLLRALRTAVHLASSVFIRPGHVDGVHMTGPFVGSPKQSKQAEPEPFAPGTLEPGTSIYLSFGVDGGYRFTVGTDSLIHEAYNRPGSKQLESQDRSWWSTGVGAAILGPFASPPSDLSIARRLQTGTRLVHLIPSALREPSSLIPPDGRFNFHDEFGGGLPGILDAVLNRGDDSFLKIVEGARTLFPTVRSIRLRPISRDSKAIDIELVSGTRVPAMFVSEGLLFYVAFAALQFLDPVGVLLVEEPENGLHPARIAHVMRILREISRETQVLLATHSPLVINELQGDEVSLVTRDPESGTQVKRLSETPHFAERSKVYALGELWLSYANGVDEAPLLGGAQSDR